MQNIVDEFNWEIIKLKGEIRASASTIDVVRLNDNRLSEIYVHFLRIVHENFYVAIILPIEQNCEQI